MEFASENAAHRIAVEWEAQGRTHEGVYIPRRDTSARVNALIGERLVPGTHHHARFVVDETPDHLSIRLASDDGQTHIAVVGRAGRAFARESVFG